ncbi:MAG: putative photosynthetic complex assembly protein PuhC [Marinovum sp.]|nr:putative photosynthetic complex assembly protein PuhC [Marinovum sp.]
MADASARFRKPPPEIMPPVVGRALLGLLIVVLAIVTWARLTDRPLLATPPQSPVSESRLLLIETTLAGAVKAYDEDMVLVTDLPDGEGGFISTVDRVIQRVRLQHGVAQGTPVQVNRHENGRISLYDPSTDWRVDLMAFGHDNVGAFAKLLTATSQGNQ